MIVKYKTTDIVKIETSFNKEHVRYGDFLVDFCSTLNYDDFLKLQEIAQKWNIDYLVELDYLINEKDEDHIEDLWRGLNNKLVTDQYNSLLEKYLTNRIVFNLSCTEEIGQVYIYGVGLIKDYPEFTDDIDNASSFVRYKIIDRKINTVEIYR